MTKPKSIKALLTEANKLARERGMQFRLHEPFPQRFSASAFTRYAMDIDVWNVKTRSLALRCLIAALREVPVVKRGKR